MIYTAFFQIYGDKFSCSQRRSQTFSHNQLKSYCIYLTTDKGENRSLQEVQAKTAPKDRWIHGRIKDYLSSKYTARYRTDTYCARSSQERQSNAPNQLVARKHAEKQRE